MHCAAVIAPVTALKGEDFRFFEVHALPSWGAAKLRCCQAHHVADELIGILSTSCIRVDKPVQLVTSMHFYYFATNFSSTT